MKRILIIAGLTAVAVWMYKKSNEKGSTTILADGHMKSYLNQDVDYISSEITQRTNK
ncbi:hypothetical protein [Dolosigranulum pigrum]|uniref:hypothetical protein n=1 Tax=Dolosigranulum pigrum TaxID=29394 RepID=UPI0015ECB2AE|nr:hypothetical protein [Dolosigranulum pigrum]